MVAQCKNEKTHGSQSVVSNVNVASKEEREEKKSRVTFRFCEKKPVKSRALAKPSV